MKEAVFSGRIIRSPVRAVPSHEDFVGRDRTIRDELARTPPCLPPYPPFCKSAPCTSERDALKRHVSGRCASGPVERGAEGHVGLALGVEFHPEELVELDLVTFEADHAAGHVEAPDPGPAL